MLRLRLIAASIPTAFHLHGHDMLVTHKDGKPISHPYEADVVALSPGERYDVIVEMNNPGIWMTHDHIEHHTTNNGKEHGGSMLVVEYEGIEVDYYLMESMAKEKGMLAITIVRKTIGTIQRDPEIKQDVRENYQDDPQLLMYAAELVAIEFKIIAVANNYWR